MGFRLAELFVEIGARTGGVYGAIAKVQVGLMNLGPIGVKASDAITKAVLAFGELGMLGQIALSAVAAGVAAAAVGLVHCAFQAAHLGEAVAKVEQAFGTATPKVLAMADDLANRFGVVRKEILDVAASFGLMLQGAGVTRELSAGMSVALSRIAVDAASFFDVEMSEAIMRLQSGLSGEMEAVRRWGINLSETNVLRQAKTMGFQAKDSQDLDQSTKTLVRYKLIMDGLKAAAGDAERSQFRLIGQWKIFTGYVSELAITFGERLLPVLTGAMWVLNWFLGVWVKIEQAINKAGKALIGWAAGLFGWDVFGEKEKQANQEAIDKRIAQTEADQKKDAELAKKNELAAKKEKEPKGWQGGIEEWAKHLQEAAWGKDKDKIAKDQLKEQQATNKLLEEIKKRTAPAGAVVT